MPPETAQESALGTEDIGPRFLALLAGVAPALCLIYVWKVPTKVIIGWGVVAWAGGVLFKWVVYRFVIVRILHSRLSDGWLGATQGTLSAASELGAAALVFVYLAPKLTLLELIGFGAGAAFAEGILVGLVRNPLAGTPTGAYVDEQSALLREQGGAGYWLLGAVERIEADVAHICSRGLVYVSLITSNPAPALVALVTFGAVDGTAYFALLRHWQFSQTRVAVKLYGIIGAIAGLQWIAFVLAYASL